MGQAFSPSTSFFSVSIVHLWWTLWKWDTGFPPSTSVFPVSIVLPMLHTLSSTCWIYRKDTRANLRKLPQTTFFSESGSNREKSTFTDSLKGQLKLDFTSHRSSSILFWITWQSRRWFASPTAIVKRQLSVENCRCEIGMLSCNIQCMSCNCSQGPHVWLEASRSRKRYPDFRQLSLTASPLHNRHSMPNLVYCTNIVILWRCRSSAILLEWILSNSAHLQRPSSYWVYLISCFRTKEVVMPGDLWILHIQRKCDYESELSAGLHFLSRNYITEETKKGIYKSLDSVQ